MSRTAADTILLTPTWAGDLTHFRLLRASIRHSPLADLEHHVVVQTEDLALFEPFANEPNVVLRTTSEILPTDVERRRRRTRHIAAHAGRHLTRISGSLRRTTGWPRWPSYTGWHTQQLCKLAVAAEKGRETTLVLDSDVVVTPSAQLKDFRSPGAVVCLAQWQPFSELRGKVRNWAGSAAQLIGHNIPEATQEVNTYFDTPFILSGDVLRSLLQHLEQRSGLQWWQHLLNQPPRRWSEFGIYKQYLRTWTQQPVEWRAPEFTHYIYDTSNADALVSQVSQLLQTPHIHYITIHSQSSGKQSWSASDYMGRLLARIEEDTAND